MPRGDRTGPMGLGPRTERGWRHWFHATGVPGRMRFGGHAPGFPQPDPELEKQELRNMAETLASELEAIQKRISELETGSAEK